MSWSLRFKYAVNVVDEIKDALLEGSSKIKHQEGISAASLFWLH